MARAGNVLRYEAVRLLDGCRGRALHLILRYGLFGPGRWPQSIAAPPVREVFARAEAAYHPGQLKRARAMLVRATHGEGSDRHYRDWLVDEHFDWDPFLPDSLAVVDIPGGHSSMFREPNVEVMATAITAALYPASKQEETAN